MRFTGLPSIPFADRANLPEFSGVYFVCSGQQVLYVGQSNNIRDRWKQHHRSAQLSQFGDVRIYWLHTPVGFLGILEKAMINQLSPLLNEQKIEIESQPKVATSEGKPFPLGTEALIERRKQNEQDSQQFQLLVAELKEEMRKLRSFKRDFELENDP